MVDFTNIACSLSLLLALLCAWLIYYTKLSNKKWAMPEPQRWPIIGHLHLLFGPDPLHIKLEKLADQYGPVLHLQAGFRSIVVVSSPEVARECFTTNDRAFASRPPLTAGKILGLNSSMIPWAPYGPYWRDTRKLCTSELLTTNRLFALGYVRDEETCNLVKGFRRACQGEVGSVVNVRKHLMDLVLHTILRMVGGGESLSFEDVETVEEFKELVEQAFYYAGVPLMGDSFPFLKWLDRGSKNAMTKIITRLKSVNQSWINERRLKGPSKKGQDFLDVLMAIADQKQLASAPGLESESKDLAIISTVQALIFGTMDTTSISMEWALSELLSNPAVLKKVQDEINTKVGMERILTESDVADLPYLKAVVKETLRLHPPGPLLVPHHSIEDCRVAGFSVPSGTQLLVNAWKIHRDPKWWENPLQFHPERFMKGYGSAWEVDLVGRHFQLIPFGAGRRACPGTSLALSILHLAIGRLLHGFEWKVPPGIDCIDMREGLGFSCPRAVPLEALIVPSSAVKSYI